MLNIFSKEKIRKRITLRHLLLYISGLLVVTACSIQTSNATTLKAMSVKDMTQSSAGIVTGRVVSVNSQWDASRKRITTITEFEVSETVKGQLGNTIRIETPGGTVGDISMRVAGSPQFKVGNEVLLFVGRASQGSLHISGFSQGNFSISTDESTGQKYVKQRTGDVRIVKQEQSSIKDVEPSADSNDGGQMRLNDFISEIRTYMNEGNEGVDGADSQ